jgi:lysophospholipase L1-like esterase
MSMKHLVLFAVPVALILLASLAQCAPEYVQQTAKLATQRDGLGNVIAKLKAGKEVRIAYFGGSITAQEGWRPKTLKWFQEQYPNAKVSQINAAIGGTGSDLGVYRFKQDVLDRKPDLVFVEFAVNDGGAPPPVIWRNMEGIIRQAWKADPNIDICYVYTMVADMAADYDKGFLPRAAGSDDMLAEYYGIPSISVGYRTAELAREGKLWYVPKKDDAGKDVPVPEGVIVWSDDKVHPRDAGHVVYTQAITEALAQWTPTSVAKPHALKDPFVADNAENAKFAALDPSMLTPGWTKLPTDQGLGANFHGFMPEIWTAGKPGEKISFKFKGTTVKLYDLMGPTMAKAIITIDSKANTVAQFDWWCNGWRLACMGIAEGLPNEVHSVTVEISPEQPDRKVVTDRFKDDPKFDPKAYDGTDLYIGPIMLIGDIVK